VRRRGRRRGGQFELAPRRLFQIGRNNLWDSVNLFTRVSFRSRRGGGTGVS
jgi:hypothetical protein